MRLVSGGLFFQFAGNNRRLLFKCDSISPKTSQKSHVLKEHYGHTVCKQQSLYLHSFREVQRKKTYNLQNLSLIKIAHFIIIEICFPTYPISQWYIALTSSFLSQVAIIFQNNMHSAYFLIFWCKSTTLLNTDSAIAVTL